MSRRLSIDEAIKAIEYIRQVGNGEAPYKNDRQSLALDMAIEALQERKTGNWIDTADKYDKRARRHDYYCSECRTFAGYFIGGYEDWWCCKPPEYCPYCGAKMEVDE